MITESQQKLINLTQKISRRGAVISVGPDEKDYYGRQLKLSGQGVDETGTKLKPEVLALLKKLQTNEDELATTLQDEILPSDIRSSVWKDHPELSVLSALAYATILVKRSGCPDGHIVHIAVDPYEKHFEAMSSFADTLLRTGICKNGGGIIYWGIENGGLLRNVAQYLELESGEKQNWVFGTMSYCREDYVGAKFGMLGKIFCREDLKIELYQTLISGHFLELLPAVNHEDYVVTVGSLLDNHINIAEDLIRSRTGTTIPRGKFLKGLELGIRTSGSPVLINLVKLLRAFGANILADIEEGNREFAPEMVIDPNEQSSIAIRDLKRKAVESDRIYLALDPAASRGSIIAVDEAGETNIMSGTELLLLAMEDLAQAKTEHGINLVYDNRTILNISSLAEQLTLAGHPISATPSEPGYPFMMDKFEEHSGSILAVEKTGHYYLSPFTSKIWGGKSGYNSVQPGDDASLFLTYILALSSLRWGKRNPVIELARLRKKYSLPSTIIREYRPTLYKKDLFRRPEIAAAIVESASVEVAKSRYKLKQIHAGIRLLYGNVASLLIRNSNTSPSFTVSVEAVSEDEAEEILIIGGSIMKAAIDQVKKQSGEFYFDWNDFEYAGELK
jgi:phosphomannomutase